MADDDLVYQRPVTVAIMLPFDARVLAFATIRERGTKLEAVIETPTDGHLTEQMPGLLRWLADAVELRLLPEAGG